VALLFCVAKQMVLLSMTSYSNGSWNVFESAILSAEPQEIVPELKPATTGDAHPAESHFEMATGGSRNVHLAKELSPAGGQIGSANHQPPQPVDGLTPASGDIGNRVSAANESYSTIFGTRCGNNTHLGLPSSVRNYCGVQLAKSEADAPPKPSSDASWMEVTDCERLTCYNLLTVSPDQDATLSQAASMFMKLFPYQPPSDEEMATVVTNFVEKASSAGSVDEVCQFWRTKYSFDSLPATSPEELEFPLAFNIIAHEHVHQVATPRVFSTNRPQ
jgi:hypothetical protein